MKSVASYIRRVLDTRGQGRVAMAIVGSCPVAGEVIWLIRWTLKSCLIAGSFIRIVLMTPSLGKSWYALDVDDVLKELRTSASGLSENEARKRLEKYGPNEILREKRVSPIAVFLRQFKNVLIGILLVATLISLMIGEIFDAVAIIAIVVASAVIGFVQEYRSEKAIEFLRKLASPMATVIRDGLEKEIPAREVVPGDLLVLRSGDRVAADVRLIEAVNLRVDESPSTGESTPVEKSAKRLSGDIPLPDRVNMCYTGTIVVYGRGKGVVVATGMNTEFGRIAKMVRETRKEQTPLERRMAHVGRWLGGLSLAVCAIVAALGLLRGHGVIEMLMWGVSLAVAAVPEALPAVVTGALAIGMYEMAKKRAIVRRLPAVETLGSTTVICSDKTGTMTKGEMTVKKIYVPYELVEVQGVGYEPRGKFVGREGEIDPRGDVRLKLLLVASALCNDAKLVFEDGRWRVVGDTTEGALLVAAAKAGLLDEIAEYPRVAEVPFTPERKMMTTVNRTPDGELLAFAKGAPEVLLARSSCILTPEGVKAITAEDRDAILKVAEAMAKNALRTMAIAYRQVQPGEVADFSEKEEKDFVFLGLVGMIDPPREEAKEAIKMCESAGIKVSMVTGDHKLTAISVARDLGIFDGGDLVLTGIELDKMDDKNLEKIADKVRIYARVAPEHKARIVKALKSEGHIVAVTGDGINDAPALKMADIGIAMGVTGTEVTKEVSDMVLADDNFATIVEAIREGRRIFDNIKKYLTFLLQCNIAEILVMLVGTVLGWPLPLTAVQLLWVNLVTDGLPAIALGLDPAEPDIMNRPPRRPDEGVFTRDVKVYLLTVPLIATLILSYLFHDALLSEGLVSARTRLFTSLVMVELAIAITSRSLRHPVSCVRVSSNKLLVLAVTSSFILQLVVLLTPGLHPVFDISYPTISDWIAAFSSALLIFLLIESGKLVFRIIARRKGNVDS